MTLADFLMRVRLDANDIDADRWDDAHIIDMLNEAYCEVFNMRPDLFQKTVVAQLEEGEVQQPCCCDKLKSVDAVTDRNGVKIADIRANDVPASRALGRARCQPSSPYPSGFAIEDDAAARFTVSPAVKPGQVVFVRLTCAVKPEPYPFDKAAKMDYFGCEYYGALVDYVLFRLFATETESVTSVQRMQAHRQMFYERLGLHDKVRRVYEKAAEKVK